MAVIKQKKKNDQEVIRTKQSNLLCHWEQSWELSNLGQPILFPEAIIILQSQYQEMDLWTKSEQKNPAASVEGGYFL